MRREKNEKEREGKTPLKSDCLFWARIEFSGTALA
jgi:hypothetical protein